jgi:type II secretion system protein D
VQIEVVEGTDLFVIRGNPRDVARVMEVIREIEEMARVSEPQIVVHMLTNVDSQAMAGLLQQLFAPADEDQYTIGSYYGRLLALPLGRPNAVLLVGAPTTVAKAEEILGQLDVPSQTATQFEVFRLKHAQAEAAQTVVEELFTALEDEDGVPPAFGPKALVIAELRTNALVVRASPRDMEEVRQLVNEIDQPGGEIVNEIRVFQLRHSLATTLAPVLQRAVRGESATEGGAEVAEGLATLLRLVTIDAEGQQTLESGVLAGVTVNADQRANALVVSGPPDSMPLMAALIAELDKLPEAVAELKVFTIENGDAVSLAEMLQQLFGLPTTQAGGGQQGAAAQIFQLRFSVDERTNSIIAAGSADELLTVEAILLRLDAGESRSRLNKVYRLKNAFAGDVALALQDWLLRKREVEQTAPGVISPFTQLEREIVVVAEPASNSLIVSATPDYYKELEGIIQQLDEQAPMVMIQVLIGEVRLGDADEFGLELGLQDSTLFDRSLLENLLTTQNTITQPGGGPTVTTEIIQSADLTPGFNFGNPAFGLPNSGSDKSLGTASKVAAQGLSSFAVNRVSPDLGFGGFVLSASSNSISMLLRALQESRRLEVLSRPQIMALDNQEGRSFVGQIVPIITSTQFNQITGTPINTTEQQPVGLELIVRPRINKEDLVVMTIWAFKRELVPIEQGIPIAVDPAGNPIRSPIINSTEAQTTVSAVSGQTVVLSGLLTKRDEALHRRVPLLADIPLVGDLFRFDSTRLVRTELLIILTPHVVRGRLEVERLNQVESARMNWCLSDVVDLHGPAGLRSRSDMLGAAEAETVYPVLAPGELDQVIPPDGPGLTPTPAIPDEYGAPGEPMPTPPAPNNDGVTGASYPQFPPR